MKLQRLAGSAFAITTSTLALLAPACVNSGSQGSSAVTHPAMTGTVYTIILENKDEAQVLGAGQAPYLESLARAYGHAAAYAVNTHPSLPNYITLTSGSTQGITDDADPASHPLTAPSLGDQLDAAHVPWRAYMESMGAPCGMTSTDLYGAKHDPFVYYTSLTNDPTRCADHVVDFDQNFAADLASNQYRFMWITPNMCNDMHNCTVAEGDTWLSHVVPQILASPGYQQGGAIFILFDEGGITFDTILNLGNSNVAALVVSPNIVSPGYVSNIGYDHQSYLATVEDMFGMPRLATTVNATPMSDFFAGSLTAPPSADAGVTTTSSTDAGTSATGP